MFDATFLALTSEIAPVNLLTFFPTIKELLCDFL